MLPIIAAPIATTPPRVEFLGEELLERPIEHRPEQSEPRNLRFEQIEQHRLAIEAGQYVTPEKIATLINRLVR